MFEELANFGELENLNVCDNVADHMVGSVYAKFRCAEGEARGMCTKFYAYNHKQHSAFISPVCTGAVPIRYSPLHVRPPPFPTQPFTRRPHPPPTPSAALRAARRDEECAAKALQALTGRFYGGRPIGAEFSPVTGWCQAARAG